MITALIGTCLFCCSCALFCWSCAPLHVSDHGTPPDEATPDGTIPYRFNFLTQRQSLSRIRYRGAVSHGNIKDCSRRGDIVLDTFCGSGTTILAAERVGRHARALEIESRFVDVAIRRWQAFTRRDAVHAETGLSFDEIAADTAPSERGLAQ